VTLSVGGIFPMNSALQFAISIGHSKEFYVDKNLIYGKKFRSAFRKNLGWVKIIKMGVR